MANHQDGSKGEGKKLRAGNVQAVALAKRSVAAKVPSSNTMLKSAIGAEPHSIRGKVATARLVNSMDLDEMLEASKVIEMGIKGEKIPSVKSSKAQRYARTILRLCRKSDTRPIAEKMMHDLNVRIIKVNKKTTDAAESKRLYHKLMAEE